VNAYLSVQVIPSDDEIIAEPFSTPNYSALYINYLNGNDEDFEYLTYTQAIKFPSSDNDNVDNDDNDDNEGDRVTRSPTVTTEETAAPTPTSSKTQ
jgi:hypothetical protein